MKRTLAFLVLLTCVACTKENPELKKMLQIPPVERKDSVHLEFAENINIPVDPNDASLQELLRCQVLNGRYFFGLSKSTPHNRLICIDLESRKIIRDIPLSDKDLKDEGITTFVVHSLDSIFFQVSNTGRILLMDGNGALTWRVQTTGDHKLTFPAFLPQHQGSVDVKRGLFYSTLLPTGYFIENAPEFDNANFQGIFDMKEGSWVRQYGPLEGVMKIKGETFYPPDLSLPYSLIHGGKALVNYPMDHFVYIYDLTTGSLLDKRLMAGTIERSFPEPLSKRYLKANQEVWNFRIQSPFYEPLFYHRSAKLFTRTMHASQSLKLPDGRLNDGSDRRSQVVIMNDSFEIVGETVIEHGGYPVHGAVATPDGMLIQQPGDRSDFITLKRFVFTTQL